MKRGCFFCPKGLRIVDFNSSVTTADFAGLVFCDGYSGLERTYQNFANLQNDFFLQLVGKIHLIDDKANRFASRYKDA